MNTILPRSGTAFILRKGERLQITDIKGEQVSDFTCFSLDDPKEYLSSGRTIDYAETIFLTTGHPFYSNRSNIMFNIIEDTVGRHDFCLRLAVPIRSGLFTGMKILTGDVSEISVKHWNLLALIRIRFRFALTYLCM
uniref:Urea carboxylase-associated family protein n=1 Tax=Chryseobacterium endophyticum TaxID=1854762 RepID=A0AAU6WMC4_9FLAO